MSSVLPSVIFAKERGFAYVFLPEENLKEASLIPEISLIPVTTLSEVFQILCGNQTPTIQKRSDFSALEQEHGAAGHDDFSMII